MQRIMIIGGPGSGKSTLARELGVRLCLPVVHIDPMFWAPGWVQREADETRAMIAAAAAAETWIFEGNSSENYAGRAARADLVLFLDLPRPLRLWRIFRRLMMYRGQSRPEMPADCPERLDLGFLAEVWSWDQRTRPKALALLARQKGQGAAMRLTSPRQVRRFLADPDRSLAALQPALAHRDFGN